MLLINQRTFSRSTTQLQESFRSEPGPRHAYRPSTCCWSPRAGDDCIGWAAWAERRVALVVGNGAYSRATPLANPAPDAKEVAESLKRLGFQVFLQADVDQGSFAQALDAYLASLQDADVGLFYFAGHGLQMNGQNYLLSTSATGDNEFLVPSEGMELGTIVSRMEARAPVAIVFVDACRDNPFAAKLALRNPAGARGLSANRGLAPIERHGRNTMIVYATAANQTAADGVSGHSPFATALLRHIGTPGLEVSAMLKRVTRDVLQSTNNQQQPEVIASMAREFYFDLGAAASGQPTEPPKLKDDPAAQSAFAFSFAQRVGTAEAYRYFLETFPTSIDAAAARQEIVRLEPPPAPAAQAASRLTTTASPLPDVRGPGGTETEEGALNLSKEQRSGVQIILTSLGYDAGGISGFFSPQTRVAIRSLQYALQHDPTGFLSRQEYDYLAARKEQAKRVIATMAVQLSPDDLPEGTEPRLKKAVAALAGRPIKFGFIDRKLYIAVAGLTQWDEARKLAREAGGDLAIIASKRENDFAYALIAKDQQFWQTDTDRHSSGGYFTNGPYFGIFQDGAAKAQLQGWKTVDGHPMTYSNWFPYQPSKLRLKREVGTAAFGGESRVPIATWQDQPVFSGSAPGFIMQID